MVYYFEFFFFFRYNSDISDQNRATPDDLLGSREPIIPDITVRKPTTQPTPQKSSIQHGSSIKFPSSNNNNNNSNLGGGKRINFLQHDHYLDSQTSTISIDTRLNEFLIKHGIDGRSRNIIFSEDFTYEDFVYDLERTDLLRIGLK